MVEKRRLNVIIVLAVSLMFVFGSLFLLFQNFVPQAEISTCSTSVSDTSLAIAETAEVSEEMVIAQKTLAAPPNATYEGKIPQSEQKKICFLSLQYLSFRLLLPSIPHGIY